MRISSRALWGAALASLALLASCLTGEECLRYSDCAHDMTCAAGRCVRANADTLAPTDDGGASPAADAARADGTSESTRDAAAALVDAAPETEPADGQASDAAHALAD